MDLDEMFSRFTGRGEPLVPVIRLYGLIGMGGPVRSTLNLAQLAGVIERAFKARHVAAVALAVNSPGGSPVQSSLIAGRLRQLADEKKVPLIAFVEDVAASGGYWLASAADEIFVDPASIVGSIGVVSAGFGFHDLLGRIGVERRVHAKGSRKVLLDPFRPERPEDLLRLEVLQSEMHEIFKDHVRARRAGKLKADDAALFDGDVWTGRRAVELGLADGIGDLRSEMRRRFGDKVRLRALGERKSWLKRSLGLGGRDDWAGRLIAAAEERAAFARFGL